MSLVPMKNKKGEALRCEPRDVERYKAEGYKVTEPATPAPVAGKDTGDPTDSAAAGGPGGGDDDSKKEPAKGGEADASKAADKGG